MGRVKVTDRLIKDLEQQGYVVKHRPVLERKTFVVEKETLDLFLEARAKSGMKLQDAVTQALKEWAQKKR